jgi:DNA-binding transcriptional MerR regulator
MDAGLLPQPEDSGRYAYFNDSYLARLKLIQRLKEAYLPLKEIKRVLDTLSDEHIKEYAGKTDLSEIRE